MALSCDVLILGAGIVGLSTARELRRRRPGLRVVILEKEPAVGAHASGRNSGVLHSGVYYPKGSLKARFCAEGARRMLAFARENGVRHDVCGKLIVPADEAGLAGLRRLRENAEANGIRTEWLDERQAREAEPLARPFQAALRCPDTAVVDVSGVLAALVRRLTEEGVEIRFGEEALSPAEGGRAVRTSRGETVSFGFLVNCAGAHADRVAGWYGFCRSRALIPFKGLYRRLAPEMAARIRGLIYPVPDPAFPFLGVHFTKGVDGEVYVGPTAVPALGRENYGFLSGIRPGEALAILWRLARLFVSGGAVFRRLVLTESARYRAAAFAEAARVLVPEVRERDLLPCEKVGIRPQLVDLRRNALEMDFVAEGDDRSLHVLNAISPAFTSSFTFAEYLADRVRI